MKRPAPKSKSSPKSKPTRPPKKGPKHAARASRSEGHDDELQRRFDGRKELDALLTKSGALGDVEDVVQAFRDAVAKEVPPQPVIMALWEDEPRFESPDDAEQLFSNLLGLYELVAGDVLRGPAMVLARGGSVRPEPSLKLVVHLPQACQG